MMKSNAWATIDSSPLSPVEIVLGEDLVLSHILGYAVEGLEDFATVTLVNQRWRHVLKSTVLPLVSHICKRRLSQEETFRPIDSDVALLEMILTALKIRSRSLEDDYTTTSHRTKPREWLAVPGKENFHSFVYQVCTAKTDYIYDLSWPVHFKMRQYLDFCAKCTARNMARALTRHAKKPQEDNEELLVELLEEWNMWKGLTQTSAYLASYTDRMFVEKHHYPSLEMNAHLYLAKALVNEETMFPLLERFLASLETHCEDSDLMSQAYRACESLRTRLLARPVVTTTGHDITWRSPFTSISSTDDWESLWRRFEKVVGPTRV